MYSFDLVRTSEIVCLDIKDEYILIKKIQSAALKASTTVAPTVWMKWLYCFYHTAWTAAAEMTHSLNSSWSFFVVILSQGKESPLSVGTLPPFPSFYSIYPFSDNTEQLIEHRWWMGADWWEIAGLMLIDTAVSLHLLLLYSTYSSFSFQTRAIHYSWD